MEKMERSYNDGHWTGFRKRMSSPCMRMPTKQKSSHNLVWVPKIPSWEKEFCYKIGLFKWEDLLEAKKGTEFSDKIFEWNDSAAEEAFHRAKNRFFAQINNLQQQSNDDLPSPDLYIDDIHWDDNNNNDDNDHLMLEMCRSRSDEDKQEDEHVPDYYHIRIEDIKPTGWDVDVAEFSAGKVLTGLIVGY